MADPTWTALGVLTDYTAIGAGNGAMVRVITPIDKRTQRRAVDDTPSADIDYKVNIVYVSDYSA